jgi:hypothetical protein
MIEQGNEKPLPSSMSDHGRKRFTIIVPEALHSFTVRNEDEEEKRKKSRT